MVIGRTVRVVIIENPKAKAVEDVRMILQVNGEQVEANPKNAAFCTYDNDILNGIYVDIGQRYLYISQHYPAFEEVEVFGRMEGIPEVHHGSPDLDEAPHCWIVNTLGNLVVLEAETSLDEYGNH